MGLPFPSVKYGLHSQTKSRKIDYVNPALHGQASDPLVAFIQWLRSQSAANNFPTNITALRNDPQGDANKGYVPGVDNASNPFSNGFFKGANERIGIEAARLGEFGLTGVQAGLAPAQVNPDALARFPVGQVMPEPPNPFMGFNPTTRAIPGGFEGMINPQLPQDQKYGDANFFTARPGVSTLPPGYVAGDEKTNYRRVKPKSARGTRTF